MNFEFENEPEFILIGINITNWEDSDGDSGKMLSIGLLFFNINILF